MTKRNKHSGSSFEDFLKTEGLESEVASRAAKRTFAHQLELKMKETHTKKAALRKTLGSPTTVARLFNDHTGISLETMSRAAEAVDCDLEIRFIAKKASAKRRA